MHSHELTLGLAFTLGALHALEPGHGKTAMLLYLAGERRSLLHPLVMGLSSALSHSVSLIGIAAMVHLSGESLADYGFLQPAFADPIYQDTLPYELGFTSEERRQEALAKWKNRPSAE